MYLRSIALAGLLVLAGSADSKIVRTRSGVVNGGKCGRTDVNYFFSIPYAKPPVGELRFASPEPYQNSSYRVVNATTPAPACIQFTGQLFGESETQSENCLFLDIWAPASATQKSKLPVKVWLYGGSNEGGGVSNPSYNGCFSATDSIVVSVNYRLGPLGFLALTDLGLTGNYGLEDQLLALRWVQDNIANFGGDPEKVLLFGESAGASDTFFLATLPEIPQLVRAAAMESGAGRDIATIEDSQVWYSEFLNAMNCSTPDLSCIRSATASILQIAVASMPSTDIVTVNSVLINNGTRSSWTPVVDGKLIKEQPSAAGLKVPSIIGSNANEGSLFVLGAYRTLEKLEALNQTDYDEFLNYNFGPLAERVNGTYSAAFLFNGSVARAMETVLTEVSYKCPSYRALLQAEKNDMPVWSYRFDHVPSCPWFLGIDTSYLPLLGVTHSSEIPFVFNFTSALPPPNGNCTFTSSEQIISRNMSRAWTNMAETGQPGDEGVWPVWTSGESTGVVIGDAVNVGVVNYTSCAFWDQVNADLNEYWDTRGTRI
ncbi:alpha/beta-hydrolase [Hypoxylon trugodes]|uniref:alpha/beta-hydrolase n=1 Tax=Hypoxylon trugodes TaxID=326681 RepID=UPI00219FB88B|nr:alpha/beta-hydrolase [Hypoxylon trugodes]KAI1384755.1 alpha/beta-hydrolase [Hypoxylon trugodes]